MLGLAGFRRGSDTIKIGVMEPLSGTFKDIGDRYLEGVQYAAKIINESGGLLGKKVAGSSRSIPSSNRTWPHPQGSGAGTQGRCQVLLRRDGKLGWGGHVQVAEKENVIMFTYGMIGCSMTGEKCNKNFFRAGGQSTDGDLTRWRRWSPKRVQDGGIIGQDYSFGHEAVAAFKKKLAQISPSTSSPPHPAGTKDYAPYASQLIAAKPDVIFTPNWGNDLTLLLKQGRAPGNGRRFSPTTSTTRS